MLLEWSSNIRALLLNTQQMVRIAWQAYPAGLSRLVLIELCQGLIPLSSAWITKLVFDLLLQHPEARTSPDQLILLLISQGLLLWLSLLIAPITMFQASELGRRLTLQIETNIYQKINSLAGLAPLEDPNFHNAVHLASASTSQGPAQALQLVVSVFRGLVTVVSFFSVLIAHSPLLAGVVCISVLPNLWAQLRITQQRHSLVVGNNPLERRAWYLGALLSDVRHAKEVRLFSLGEYLLSEFRRVQLLKHATQRRQQVSQLQLQFMLGTVNSGVISFCSALIILNAFAGQLSIGDVTLFSNAVPSLQGAFVGVIMSLALLHENSLFHTRYKDLMSLPQPIHVAERPRPVPRLTNGVELRNVSFRYTKQHPYVLRNLNLFIPAGKCVALVGVNGSGKTTLVKLLARFYDPTEGQILWDGYDIREFAPEELRKHLGVTFQDFAHFELSARENIGFGDISRVEDIITISQAARTAGIYEVLERLPQGLETTLSRTLLSSDNSGGQTGADLSGGEWQKIATARTFMREADFLLLDEPTAALDAQSEQDLYSQFSSLTTGRTTLLITHRLSSIRMVDLVALLEDGKITEFGSHKTLMALGGTYSRLYKMQANCYNLS